MITIYYFARFREKLGIEKEQFELPERGDVTVNTVIESLAARGGIWADLFDCEAGVMCAINQEVVMRDSSIYEDDELSLFPPVTGG